MPGGLKPCACGTCLPCVTWERDAALNRIDRALHVLDTGKHFVPLRVRAILAGEASGKDAVPMVRAEVAYGLRARISELAAGLEDTRNERDSAREKALEDAANAIRQGLAELANMPTPTKGHEVLAELQRNLLAKCVSEIEALKPNPRRGDE